jgi:SAM-dependent methyltransferase
MLKRIVKLKLFGKSPVNAYLRVNQRMWKHLPAFLSIAGPIVSYGNFLNALARFSGTRKQAFYTVFFRNRPELELIARFASQRDGGSALKISVLACSQGAEVYSILWTIRSVRPDMKVIMHAVDISSDILELGRQGVYPIKVRESADEPLFHRMTEHEMREMFDREGARVKVKSWIKEGIIWHCGDAGNAEILNALGQQDVVVANNFLCHMEPSDAEKCLRNIARLVTPGGYLFISGIDLDVRSKVARDLAWKPVLDLMEDIHEGDPILRDHWPWHYSGLEPLNKKRLDWKVRYAAVFQLG